MFYRKLLQPNKQETKEEREKRLFELIKQRQSIQKENGYLPSVEAENYDSIQYNDSTDNFNPAIENMFPLDPNIDLEKLNTSTFGYAIKHSQKVSQSKRSEDHDVFLDEGEGVKPNHFKMNKRYINNKLTESDSSCEDHIMQGKYNDGKFPIASTEQVNYERIVRPNFSSGSKHSRGMSDVEPIMIYADEETEDGASSRNELLQRILARYERNTKIYQMKAGISSFMRNCISKKKVLNIVQVLVKVNMTTNVKDAKFFFYHLGKVNKTLKG